MRLREAETSAEEMRRVPPASNEKRTTCVSSYSRGMLRAETEVTRSSTSSRSMRSTATPGAAPAAPAAPDAPDAPDTVAPRGASVAPEAPSRRRKACAKGVRSSAASSCTVATTAGNGVLPCSLNPQPPTSTAQATSSAGATVRRITRPR